MVVADVITQGLNKVVRGKKNLSSSPCVVNEFALICGNGVLFKQTSQR